MYRQIQVSDGKNFVTALPAQRGPQKTQIYRFNFLFAVSTWWRGAAKSMSEMYTYKNSTERRVKKVAASPENVIGNKKS
jgi:hypothetical protein